MKKLDNIGGYPTLLAYAEAKLARYGAQEKNYKTLFEMMFSERDNIMAESTDGYRIKKLTYGQFRQWILECVPSVRKAIGELPADSMVGIYMNNSMQWLVVFWTVLICGYRPLLLNTRLDSAILEQLLAEQAVQQVISDSRQFSVSTLMAEDILIRAQEEPLPEQFGTEVIFMSSGTSDHVKLCAYTGENFYYQVCCSIDIIKKCPDIAAHYHGQLRQLMLLPLCHVFGFMAVYLWFGFFSRTFVFLRDMHPNTILNTVRKHKVTHIFAVPLVWDMIHREAMRKIRARGDKTLQKFQKGLKLCNATGKLGDRLAKKLLSEVRDGLFGPSVQFMISGGSPIQPEVVEFFNGIGYTLVNGYGMTEIGITSVETDASKKIRNKAAIGIPFRHVEYEISPEGELLIRSKAMASRITVGSQVSHTDHTQWFCSHDLARQEGQRYYLGGRADDLIVCENGENINPVLTEPTLAVPQCASVCLIADDREGPVLLAYAPECYTDEALSAITQALSQALQSAKLANAVHRIAVTSTPLLEEGDIKLNRNRLKKKYAAGQLFLLTPQSMADHRQQARSALEKQIRSFFAEVLNRDEEEIGLTQDFFSELGGTSLDFFMLKDKIKQYHHIDIVSDGQAPTTVQACCLFITNQKRG